MTDIQVNRWEAILVLVLLESGDDIYLLFLLLLPLIIFN
jgi:hypothetical protein